jgi:hypothetical protein
MNTVSNFSIVVVLGVILFCCQLEVQSQDRWELKKSGNGISVYLKDSESKFKTVKVHAVLNGTKAKLVRILQAVELNTDWVYATKRSYLVEKSTDSNLIYYAETALPWPMKNRDQPIHMIIYPESADSILTITTIGEPGRLPENRGLVRIQTFSGTWKVKTINPDQIEIDYILNVDPSGSVPAWLVNMFVSKGPYETFSKLAVKLKE